MIQEGQGVTEHRWIGFIVFKITNKFIKYKTSDSVGTTASQCAELESKQSGVAAILPFNFKKLCISKK